MFESTSIQWNQQYYSPKLLEKLKGILFAPVTVVEAPAGYGKTTAVRGYLEHNLPKDMEMHWWDAVEDDPTASWNSLCRVISLIDLATGKELHSLGFPKPISSWEVGKAISGLSCNRKTVLVLDDFQYLQRKLSRSVMVSLLSYLGEHLHLVIITQSSRPFSISIFEKANVHRIRIEDLRLDNLDIRCYCRMCGCAVTAGQAKKILEYTEGWIAAVYLTILQIRKGEGLEPGLSLIQLMETIVWNNMSDQGKELLFHISLFQSVSIEQIEFLLHADPLPDEVLQILDGMPFVRYEPESQSYIPHPVLREMLRRRLKAAGSEVTKRCYGSAGRWYAKSKDCLRAIECFFIIKDYEGILSLPLEKVILEKVGDLSFSQIAGQLVLDCSQEIKRKYPLSLLRIAYAFIGAGKKVEAVSLLKEIREYINEMESSVVRQELTGEWHLIEAFLHFPDIHKMELGIKKATEKISGRCQALSKQEPFSFGLPLMIFFHKVPGMLDREIQVLSNVIDMLSDLTGVKYGADILLQAEAALYRGNFTEAEKLSHQAAFLAEGSTQWAVSMGTLNIMAQLAVKRGSNRDLSQYMKGLEDAGDKDSLGSFVSQLLQTDYYMWLGLTELIPESVRGGRSNDVDYDAPDWVRIYLGYFYIGILLQEKQYSKLLGVAKATIDQCREADGYLMVEIYMLLIAAMGSCKNGQREDAFEYVKGALKKADPDGIYLPFMEFKSVLGGLIEAAFLELGIEMPPQIIENEQLIGKNWKLLIRLSSESGVLPYGLTEREMDVATLAAKGMSNKEIATVLYITEATVKFHLRTVFSKLGIERRSKLARMIES